MQNPIKLGGPKTRRGKQVSSRNAITHGLYSKTAVLKGEDRARFRKVLDGFTAEHNPQGETERAYVQSMANHHWRNLRMMTLYKNAFEKAMDDQPPDLPPEDCAAMAMQQLVDNKFMDSLHRQEVACERHFTRALKGLLHLQDRRTAKEQKNNECICVSKQTSQTNLDAPVQ